MLLNQETLAGALEEACRLHADRIAVSKGEQALTYRDLDAAAKALARSFERLGVAAQERVICQVSNRPEHVIAALATWTAGGIHVGADHELTGRELSWLVGHTEAAVLVCEPVATAADPWAAIRTVQDEHPSTRIVVVGGAEMPGCHAFSALVNDAPAASSPEGPAGPRPEDAAAILFTSGTTGQPKGPIGIHRAFRQGWQTLADVLAFGPEDIHLGHLPLSHGYGLSTAVMALLTGGHLLLVERFSTSQALQLIGNERVTVFNGTPAHFILLTDRLDPSRHDVSSLRIGIGSAATFPVKLLRRIFDDLDMDLMLMYGSSESAGVLTTDRQTMLDGSVGKPHPGVISIVGPDHEPLPAGEIGEVAFNRTLVPIRYWRAPAASSPDPAEGDGPSMYYSGDIGRFDELGRLHVLGRLKHQIDRGGMKVDPGEVEMLLLTNPQIEDAAVIGTPNAVLGESVCACVVPAGGAAPTLADVRERLAPELAPYKLPEEMCLIDSIPRTSLGKIDREQLKSDVAALGDLQRLRER